MTACPCKECVAPKRHTGCHAKCREYGDWKAAMDEKNEEIHRKKVANQEYSNMRRDKMPKVRWK